MRQIFWLLTFFSIPAYLKIRCGKKINNGTFQVEFPRWKIAILSSLKHSIIRSFSKAVFHHGKQFFGKSIFHGGKSAKRSEHE